MAHVPVWDIGTADQKVLQLGGPQAKITGSLPVLGLYRFEAPGNPTEISKLGLPPSASWFHAEVRMELLGEPNDPWWGDQWWANAIELPAAWGLPSPANPVTVAIIDSGLNASAAEVAGRVVDAYSIPDRSSADWAWQDSNGHGTMVASVLAGQGDNQVGIAGVDWNARVMPVKLGDGNSYSDFDCTAAIVYAVDHGAQVINMSWGGDYSQPLAEALRYAADRGVVLVAAVGNDPNLPVMYPARDPYVIAVTATDSQDRLAYFSPTGSEVDLAAPGQGIVAIDHLGRERFVSGTSFSAPMVSGIISLLWSGRPDQTGVQITDVIMESANDLGAPGWDAQFGRGLVDAGSARARLTPATTTTTLAQPPTTLPPAATTTTVSQPTTTQPPVPTTVLPQSGFVDVPVVHPYFLAIADLARRGVVVGFADGTFRPLEPVRRQQFAKMIVLTLGIAVSEDVLCLFNDVEHAPNELYPYHYVAAAFHSGITMGISQSPPRFDPWNDIRRAQVITMVTRAASLPDPPPAYEPPFPNFSETHYPWARRAAFHGLLGGLEGVSRSYDFWRTATRGEAAQLLYNLARARGG